MIDGRSTKPRNQPATRNMRFSQEIEPNLFRFLTRVFPENPHPVGRNLPNSTHSAPDRDSPFNPGTAHADVTDLDTFDRVCLDLTYDKINF